MSTEKRNPPFLSIITINLNNALGLSKTIESVRNQDFNSVEFIIIDGGSTDESVKVITENGAHIDKWLSEKDKGIYNAMNKGIKLATGAYCLFLNSGDYLADSKTLSKAVELNYSEDILYGDLIFDFGHASKELRTLPDSINLLFLFSKTLYHPAVFIKRALFTTFGCYREDFKIVGDYEFFFRVIGINKVSHRHLDLPIAIYDFNGISSNAANLPLINKERAEVHRLYLGKWRIAYLRLIEKIVSKWEYIKRK